MVHILLSVNRLDIIIYFLVKWACIPKFTSFDFIIDDGAFTVQLCRYLDSNVKRSMLLIFLHQQPLV